MPKIISRSTISASVDDASASNKSPLQVYYCLCGDFALVVDVPLDALPKRPLDGSHALRWLDAAGQGQSIGHGSKDAGETASANPLASAKRTFKISARQGPPVMLRRPNGTLEKQYRFHCSRCDLPLGYEVTPPPLKTGSHGFTFLLPGALTQVQGRPPPNVFLDDHDDHDDDAQTAAQPTATTTTTATAAAA